MGMTAPAIYRYFGSLDALVAALTEDLFEELREHLDGAQPAEEPLGELLAIARAFREWSVAHPAEFALMFGNPVPGVASFEIEGMGPDHPGTRFGKPFLAAFEREFRRAPFPTPPVEVIEARLGPYIAPYRMHYGPEVPVELIYACLSAWTRLYGIVALEVFGHMRWAVTDMGALFELELIAFAAQERLPRE